MECVRREMAYNERRRREATRFLAGRAVVGVENGGGGRLNGRRIGRMDRGYIGQEEGEGEGNGN